MRVPVMQAVRGDASGVRLEEVRRARPATGQVLVRVSAVAIDRRDGEPAAGPRPRWADTTGTRTMGRHIEGVVAAPGAGVDGWALGRSVALQPEIAVRRGWFVPGTEHDGGLAEYVVAPAEGLVLLPRDLEVGVGALLALAARAHSMLTHTRLQPGESVGIWGAGSLGGSVVAVARLLGAAPVVVVDPSETARAAALASGAEVVIDPNDPTLGEQLEVLTAGRGLDIAVHAAPEPGAAPQAVSALAADGRAVLAGPVRGLGGVEWWDGRTLSGPPRVDPGSLPRLAHLASLGRLRIPVPPRLSGGLASAAELLDTAVRGGAPVPSCVVTT